jgi:glyoxylase I family protein
MLYGLDHLGLTVRDVERSAAWYTTVLGFERVGDFAAPDGERRKVFLRHPNIDVRVGLTEHRGGSSDTFDETRVGLDHLAFRAGSAAELAEWQARLAELEVPHTPVAAANSIPGAAVLVFRDPDNVQLEIFYDPAATGGARSG